MKKHENVLVFYRQLPTYRPQMSQGAPYKQKRSGKVDTGDNYGKVGISRRTDTHNDGTRYPASVLPFARDTGIHPTQKPVALMLYLIRTYTNDDDTVLDNCMGSGTTGVACAQSGRKFIGIERDDKYFAIARQRIMRANLDAALTRG